MEVADIMARLMADYEHLAMASGTFSRYRIQVLQLQRERYTDLLGSKTIPASVTDMREQYPALLES